jgi:hypothetical protein
MRVALKANRSRQKSTREEGRPPSLCVIPINQDHDRQFGTLNSFTPATDARLTKTHGQTPRHGFVPHLDAWLDLIDRKLLAPK